MSFKIGHFFCLLSRLLIGLLILAAGVFILALPESESLREKVIQFMSQGREILFAVGGILTFLGLFMIYSILRRFKRRQAYIRVGDRSVMVDESLIAQYLNTYWEARYPNQKIPFSFAIKKKVIRVNADLPYISKEEQAAFLEGTAKDLQEMFGRLIGTPHDVEFVASFAPPPKQ